ncbi:sigma-70 family RNA polymerase sigma factor [Pedobacter polaris]|uniref:Sigma-70 family RNA polymerase sigma factor n=1 Tax=Pedobacter polaris TaxID=2571273 RepID=A0A4U1CHB4_9SPHI|nr:sigma-70 family RNA polymerase sigma factor [Pedobacter polaris]
MESAYPNIENDISLFDLLKQGDESAFEKIYNRYWAELYNTAYKRLPEKEKCQDIIQNIFTDLWTRRAELEIDNPTAYLHTAVRFQVLKQISRSPKNTFITAHFETELISPLASDSELLEKEVKTLIELYIAALPEKRKNIFLMHYFEGLSTASIATKLNVSRKTVQNQLTTASHALKFKLTHMFLLILALSLI